MAAVLLVPLVALVVAVLLVLTVLTVLTVLSLLRERGLAKHTLAELPFISERRRLAGRFLGEIEVVDPGVVGVALSGAIRRYLALSRAIQHYLLDRQPLDSDWFHLGWGS